MKEFVYGTDYQYNLLKEELEDHMCHVYSHCRLPECCSKKMTRIGFEKEENTYALFIDKGITCNSNRVSDLFCEWLSVGTIKFLDFTDMKEFLTGLKDLY